MKLGNALGLSAATVVGMLLGISLALDWQSATQKNKPFEINGTDGERLVDMREDLALHGLKEDTPSFRLSDAQKETMEHLRKHLVGIAIRSSSSANSWEDFDPIFDPCEIVADKEYHNILTEIGNKWSPQQISVLKRYGEIQKRLEELEQNHQDIYAWKAGHKLTPQPLQPTAVEYNSLYRERHMILSYDLAPWNIKQASGCHRIIFYHSPPTQRNIALETLFPKMFDAPLFDGQLETKAQTARIH